MKRKFEQFKKLNKHIQITLTLMILAVLIFLVTLSNVYTETYDIQRYTTASETIQSPISIEDTKETERRQREVLQAVEDRYLISTDVTEERVAYVEELFEVIETVNESVIIPPNVTPDDEQIGEDEQNEDRKSTRLNSRHVAISYAVYC